MYKINTCIDYQYGYFLTIIVTFGKLNNVVNHVFLPIVRIYIGDLPGKQLH